MPRAASGIAKHELELSLYDVIMRAAPAEDASCPSPRSRTSPCCRRPGSRRRGAPAGRARQSRELALAGRSSRPGRLRLHRGRLPAIAGLAHLNVLAAGQRCIIPIQCEYYGLEGFRQLLNTVRLVQQNFNPGLAISGVLLTMYDARLNLCRQVAEDAKEYFGAKMFLNADSAKRAARGSAQLRQADSAVRRAVGRAQELSLGRAGADAPVEGRANGRSRRGHPAPRSTGGDHMTETKRLGRGLEALLGPSRASRREASGALRELPVGSDRPNPYQPRTRLDEAALRRSWWRRSKPSGLLQPVVVRPRNGGYELIAGERRWRAATRLGMDQDPGGRQGRRRSDAAHAGADREPPARRSLSHR